jgi:hypothetical protein
LLRANILKQCIIKSMSKHSNHDHYDKSGLVIFFILNYYSFRLCFFLNCFLFDIYYLRFLLFLNGILLFTLLIILNLMGNLSFFLLRKTSEGPRKDACLSTVFFAVLINAFKRLIVYNLWYYVESSCDRFLLYATSLHQMWNSFAKVFSGFD